MEVSKLLNWEYDAEAEKRVLREESRQQGRQEGAELLAKFIKEGTPIDEALEKVKSSTASQPS